MTISYSGNFCRLLLRWKGSLWRVVWKELLVYLALFYLVKLYYLKGIDYLSEDENERRSYRAKFEALCRMFNECTKLIPITFLLGFYVSNVVSRRDVSKKIRLRFPNVSSLVDAGLLTEKEFEALENLHAECETIRWMAPLHWIQQIMQQEQKDNNPPAAFLNNLLTELRTFRQSLRKLFAYDWVCVPLVYTQVTALATYCFFFFSLFGRQVLLTEVKAGKQIDTVVPLFTIFQFMFFVGWFKVGQDLMRPFGLDDDDIELNYLLDRNFETSFAIVNRLQMHRIEPEDDRLWKSRDGKLEPLPHSPYSRRLVEHRPKLHSFIRVDNEDKAAFCITSMRRKRHIYW